MAKKSFLKKLKKQLFGRSFNIWDVLIWGALLGWIYLIVSTEGWIALYKEIGAWLFGIIIIGRYLIKFYYKSRK